MKKAKVLIALMLVVSLVFPSVGMAAGGAKASNGTKEVSGKPEIKILDCQWYYSMDYGDHWTEINKTFDFSDKGKENVRFENKIKIKSNQKLEGDVLIDYSFIGGNYTTNLGYNIEPTDDENIYLLTVIDGYSPMEFNKYNKDNALEENKIYQPTTFRFDKGWYNLDELLTNQSNNPTSIKLLNMVDDFDAPVLKDISITKPEGDLKASDNICIEAEIEENVSGVRVVDLDFDCIYGNDVNKGYYTIHLKHKQGNKYFYKGDAFEGKYPPTQMRLDTVWIEDYAENYHLYGYKENIDEEILKLPVDVDFDMNFIDGNTAHDSDAPVIKDIKTTNKDGVEKNIFKENDWPINLTATIEDDKSGVEDVIVEYSKGNKDVVYQAVLKGDGNKYSAEMSNMSESGDYELYEIYVRDKNSNFATYTYTGVDEYGFSCKKLEKNIDFTFNMDKPVLTDIKVTDENGKEKYTFDENDEYCYIEALAEDEGSGVEHIEVDYKNSKTGDIEEFYLEKDSNGKFVNKEYLYCQPKKYTLEKIVVYDNYENTSTYTYTGIDEDGLKCEKLPGSKNIDINFKNGSDEKIAPTLESFSINNTSITAPGTIKGKIKASDNESSDMDVEISYENINDPSDEIYIEKYAIESNVESEFSYDIGENFRNAEYRLKYIALTDENNNTVYYGDKKDTINYSGEKKAFHNKVDQRNIKIKNATYTDIIKLVDLKDGNKISKYKENSKIYVSAQFGKTITTKMLNNIKNANKNIEFVFDIVDGDDFYEVGNLFIFNSNSITDEYINSLAGRSISLDMVFDEECDYSFGEEVAKGIVGKNAWLVLCMNLGFSGEFNEEAWNQQARNIFIKYNCEELIPFVENYATNQNIPFYKAAQNLTGSSCYTVLDTGNNKGIKFPKGSRFEIRDDDEGEFEMKDKPYKVYYSGKDFNNLKEYKCSTANFFPNSVVIEDPGEYYITKGTLGYKDAIVDISNAKVTGIINRYYTGKALTQNVVVNCGAKNLVKDRDYTVSYENNTNVGTAKLTITGKGAYKGKIVKSFNIYKKASTLNVPTKTFYKKYGNKKFNLGVSSNTAISYISSNKKVALVDQKGNVTIKGAGIANITVTALGNGNYKPVQKTVKISVAKASGTVKASSYKKVRNSKKFKLNAKSTSGGKLTYSSSNKKVAVVSTSGYVTIKGIGKTTITVKSASTANYNSAYKKVTVTVVPKTMKINKVKVGKGSMKVYWSKDKEVSGYQIVIAKDSKFKTGKKTYSLSKNKYTSKSISKLSKKRTYYVKMRSYKKIGKTYYYSNYSSVKKIKTK